MKRQREWKACPICGDTDMRWEPDGDEDGYIVTCTNLACRSNGGDYDVLLDKMENSLPFVKEFLCGYFS